MRQHQRHVLADPMRALFFEKQAQPAEEAEDKGLKPQGLDSEGLQYQRLGTQTKSGVEWGQVSCNLADCVISNYCFRTEAPHPSAQLAMLPMYPNN